MSGTGDDDIGEGTSTLKDINQSPPAVVQQMEEVYDRLKILNFGKEFRTKLNSVQFHRDYFAFPDVNPSNQFDLLVVIVTWLMKLCKQDFQKQKYDDPNATSQKILLALKTMGFELDFPVFKLKQAHGEAVCTALSFLTEKALQEIGFSWTTPNYPTEEYAEDAKVDEDAEIGEIDTIEEIEEVVYDPVIPPPKAEVDLDDSMHHMLMPQVNPTLWKIELERVGPKLKVAKLDETRKEWRTHFEQTKLHETAIQKALPEIKNQLEHIGNQTTDTLERMITKERYINNQFEHLRQEYGEVKTKQKAITERCKEVSERVGHLTNEYAAISEQLDEIKSHMDDKGNSMTDTGPLVKIKTAFQTIKADIKTFDLRIGVVSHTLMQANIKHKKVIPKRDSEGMDPEFEFSDDD